MNLNRDITMKAAIRLDNATRSLWVAFYMGRTNESGASYHFKDGTDSLSEALEILGYRMVPIEAEAQKEAAE